MVSLIRAIKTISGYGEWIGDCQREGGLGRGAKWVMGVKRYRLPVTQSVSHGYVQRDNYGG